MITGTQRPFGHADVIARLEAAADAVADKREVALAHALIFAGPSGVGKFKTALWWTGRLKCSGRPTCNGSTCRDCKQVSAGTHPDVLQLAPAEPGASIPIEAVRDLLHSMALRPVRSGPRIAIVRDAQSFTPHAQSAMLKLLEEPPGFAVLVLVTDNASSLLPTIRSRCQMLRFGALDVADVREVLTARDWDADSAERAANTSRGSAGRALLLTPEWIEDRNAMLSAVEEVRAHERIELEPLIAELAERRKTGRPGLETLLEWQIRKVEASLGGDAEHEADELRPRLLQASHDDPSALLDDALNTAWALRALDRNGNPKLVLRELLLGVRDR